MLSDRETYLIIKAMPNHAGFHPPRVPPLVRAVIVPPSRRVASSAGLIVRMVGVRARDGISITTARGYKLPLLPVSSLPMLSAIFNAGARNACSRAGGRLSHTGRGNPGILGECHMSPRVLASYTEMINHNGTMRFHLFVTKATVYTLKLKIQFEKSFFIISWLPNTNVCTFSKLFHYTRHNFEKFTFKVIKKTTFYVFCHIIISMLYSGEVLLQPKLNPLGLLALKSRNNVLHFDCNETSPARHISELVRVEVFRGYQSERIFAVASCLAPQGLPPSNQTSTSETPLVSNESAMKEEKQCMEEEEKKYEADERV
ncbi:hypothetical protein ALC62_07953 [Cyphomyrmex costatus]|uniref:Uncharacterized protein n=1 Tax=Cyphomyrmex costatus TaxID=456900 RepID=A0A195CMM7_9HYME|nr:hypothetical protein ALC62_07953 [Cyphomyrmex costatus]